MIAFRPKGVHVAKRPADELAVIAFSSAADFESWLAEHFEDPTGIWLKFAKKASGIASVTYAEAVDVALCYGWIDGQSKSFDDNYYLQRFTPRRPRSKWSKINRDKVARLIAEGRMQPSGMAQIEAARADGRWDAAYDSPSTATVPDDFQQLLDQNPKASAFFESLNGQNRYAILYQIQDAKRPETRARRIQKFIEMLTNREKIY